jgi:hypothetical protein
MGRPPLGPKKKSRTIGVHVTQDQHDLISQLGVPGVWARRVVLDALNEAIAPRSKARTRRKQLPPAPEPSTVPPPDDNAPTQHRHQRERVGDKWVKGTNVGEYRCAGCGVEMGVLQ